ncbi:HlyC/CorC family transporter [Georgenia wutianyii]|uniref:HlyC/CorC family transporter n=3 Tax=Georgenia TaxID=154116 RepID=A0ABX5VKD6_9MICO|nr:hemolysin family protein [Georgenia wutianyii]QDB78901.1 HlyC/CorC family transporter [Georgenia wutianyii]
MDGLLPDVPEWWLLALALVSLLLTAALIAAEAALRRIGRTALTELQVAERPRAGRVARLAAERDTTLPGITLARVLAEMTTAVALTLVVADLLPEWWQVLLVAVLVAALLIAVVAGATPRRLGTRQPGQVLHALVPFLGLVLALTRPFVAVARALTPRSRLTEAEAREEAVEDLRDMVDRVSQSEQLADDERTMLQSMFELGSTLVREVMVPRPDMVTIDAGKPLTKALALFVRSGFSRVPVVGESVDDVRGVLYLKDVLRRTHMRPEAAGDAVETTVREAVFVPETILVDDLLREMQAKNFHIAMVVDEYGGIAGLVTIEDLLEELVGELTDEHDRAEPVVEHLEDGTVRVPARLPVDELGELFGLELDDDDVDSAGGLLAKALGKVPIPGAEVEVGGLHLQAERAGGRRRQIATILARAVEPPAADEEDEHS